MAEKRTFNKLPEIFRTNTLDKFFKSTVDQWFAEAQTIQISGYIGRKNPGTFKPNTDFYLPEIDHTRQNYQLEPTLVNKDVDTADVSNALFYDDTLKILSVEGSNIDNHHRLFKSKAYSWAPPIDLDKFVNYENYFWYEPAELITFNIVAGNTFINITSDIIGQKNYTSYHGIKFTNGLKVRFTGSNIAPQGFLNKDWIVRGVGNKIELLDTTDTILNNTQQYTATNITDRIDYVTIERGSVNHNPWSRTNGWYHKDVLLRGTGTSTGETYTDIVDNQWDKVGDDWDEETWDATVTQKSAIFTLDSTRQAIRPIIEFDHNLELYNYGLESVGTVTHASVVTHDNIQNGVNIKIDGITVATDDTIIFLNATNLLNYIPWDGEKLVNPATGETEGQWDSKAWDIEADPGAYQLGKIYKATILNGVCTLTEIKNILEKQKVLVLKGENLTGSEYHWDSNDWALSQQKTKTTDEPLFQLYDNDKVKLQDVGIYPSSTFVGNPIFSYDEGTGTTDTVIGKALTYKEFGQVADIVFKNNLEDTITYSNGDIIGYKYLKHYDLNKEIGAVLFVDTFDLVEATRSYAQLHGQLVSLVGNIDGITPVAGKTVILFNNTQNYNAARWDIYEWDDDIAPPTGGEPWDTTTNLPLLLGQTGIYTVSIDSSEGIDRFMLTLTTTINHGDYVTIRDGIIYSNNDLLWQTSAWADVTFKIPPEIRQQNTYNNAWNTSGDFNKQRVIERYVSTVDGTQDYNLQTTPVTNSPTDIIVTVDGELAKQSTSSTAYDYYVTADNTLTFTTNKVLSKDQLIEVRSFTKDAVNLNDIHYFEIPDSLEANPDNKEIVSASASELLGHFTSIIENQIDLTGTAYGVNNYRDTLKDRSIGNKILQHESTLLPLMNIIANDNFRVLDAIRFNQRNYVNFKNKFLQRAEFLVTRHLTTPIDTFVDIILEDMYSKRSNLKVYQDTNVLAFGKNYTTTDVTALFNSDYIDLTTQITPALTDRSKIVYVYRKKWASTDYVLLRNVSDYLFSSTTTSTGSIVTRITFTDPLQKDDLIQIRVFENIQNSFIPPTPSSLGMYQVYPPRTESDNTYFTGTKNFIVGHDGSRILMYGDYRDQCLLELEKRIYNAIPDKFISADYIPEINQYDYVPGKFRDNDYSLYEFNRVLEPVYQRWSIENKVDTFTHRDYDESSPFTWNYNKEPDNDGKEVPGGWRGIFLYYYDTHRPHTHPWEMLGFTIKPSWWEATYGPVIKSNTSLWNDLENGIIRHGNRENFLDNSYLTNNPFRRTGLSNYIPVDESGNLLDPVKAGIFGDPTTLVVDGNYSTPYGPDRDNPWTFGDWGPAEFSIRLNSVWPFIINKLAFLTRPAEWATKNWDTLNIARALTDKKQIIFNDTKKRNQIATLRYHQVKLLETSPNVEYVFGYQQWIYNLLVNNGIDYDKGFATNMKTAEVNLAYKVGGFVSNDSISIQADTYSTTRDSDSIFLPTEDKTIKIYNGASEGIRSYSGVIIEITPTGYAVYGYDPYNPVFRIIPSITTGPKKDVVIEDYSVKEYTTHYDVVAEVEYGFEFSSIQEVFDFLISYQRYLTAVGFVFDEFDADIGESLDFRHAGKEFIFWARITAWDYGAFIAVSPAANKIKLNVSTLGRISSLTEIINGTYSVLNKNGLAIPISNLHINRGPENFTITSLDGTGIFGFKVNTFKSEHIILLNNTTGFNDLVYDPVLRLRQDRLKLNLTKTADWTGEVEAKGYIVRDNTIIPNFDTTANDYRKFFNDRDAIVSKAQRDSARHLIGYQHRDYLTNITGNDDTSYEFYKGFIRQKGSKESIKRLLRNTNVTSDSEFTFYEEFALKVGDFGATRITTDNEIQIKANDVKVQNPLIEFTFEAESVDTIIDDVIQINHINDTRWLRKPKTELTTVWPIGALGYKELDALPDAGPVHGDDTTYKAYDNTILAGLNTISMAPAEPAQNSIAHVAQSPNNEFAVYKLIDSGLRPEIITSVPDSTLFSEVNVTGQEIPTIVGSQVIPTTNVGDTLEFTFDGDPASKTTVTVTTVEAAAVDDPLKIPELTLELKSDATSIAVNDSIFINTSNSGAGTEVPFSTAPAVKPVVVIGTQELPIIYNDGTVLINGNSVTFYTGDTLTTGTIDGSGNSTILEKLTSVPNVIATIHQDKIKLTLAANSGGILRIADQGTGIARQLGFEEGTSHWALTIDQIMADIITADVPSLSITKVSDVKLKLISSTSNLSVSKGIGPAIDRLLLTNKNGFEVTKIDTSRVTIDTIIADINSTIIKEDFKASKTSIGTLQIEFNGDSLEVGGTGLSGLGISAQTSSLQASSVAQHMFEDGDVVILNNVLNLDGSASELGGGYKISTISETHSLNVKIVNGSILITNLKTNEITALSDVNSIPLYDIVGADRDYIKHLSLTILSTIAPTQITVGDTIDIDSILTTMHGGVGKYYGAEKLYSTLTGNIIVKTVGTGNFTHGEFTINFTVEKKGKFYIIGQNIDVCNSASNILWWKKRNVKTKDELFQDVKTNQSHYALNDLGWVENKPNGWLVEQYIDNKEHYGVSTFALGSGGDNYIAADIGAILTYTVDETNTKTAPTAQIDSIAYALSNVTITNSGAGYTSPPNVTFTGGTPSIIGTGLAILSSAITGVTITNSGAGYQQVPNVEIVTSPGATATVRMQLDDAIGNSESSDTCSGIRIKNGGTGYTQGDTIVIAGGTETTKASATVSSIGSGGVITGLSQTSNNYLAMGDYIVLPNCIDNESEGGTGSGLLVDLLWNIKSLSISEDTNNDFQVAPDLNIDAPTNASGCTTLVTAQATANLVGIVSRVDIINRGAGYITIPTLTFSGGGGISAAGTTSLAGPVSSISIKDAGDLTIQPSTINVPTISTTTGTGVTLTATYQNITNFNTWFKTYRQEEKPILSKLFNVGILYDKSDHTVDATMQLLDPRKGIISGLADTEIYYKLERDPARYNNSDLDTFLFDTDEMWGEEQIGRIWWNLSTVRFLNAEQGNNRYRRENWNKVFPGSTIDIYEWTSDTVIPTAYKGTGTVLNTNRYVLKEVWNNSINNFISTYFFWVKNKTDVPSVEARSRSAIDVKNYIEIPTKQGINWYAPISSNYEWTEEIIIINTELTQTIGQSVTAADIAGVTLNGVKVKWSMGVLDDDGKMITINLLVAPTINDALRISYSRPGGALIVNNIDHLLTHEDSVLQLRYNTQATENNVHKQWILLRPDDPRSEIPSKFIDKMIDSLIGYDKTGLVIPDTTILNEIERQGTLTRPRQTWFKDLKTARKEFVYYINNIIKTFALDDERIAWDTNISSALIETLDWYAIKESTTNDEGIVTNVYWDADTAIISYTVQTVTKRNELTGIVNNDIVKVSNAGNNRWKLYQFSTAGEWIVIGSEKATRKISESVYNLDLTLAQTTELRTIIESFIDNVFIKEWTVEINKMFFNMINYVLVEQPETDWIFKSTYATTTVAENDVQQKSKWKVDLLPSTEEYINEVKPYSTKIREFIGVKNIKLDQANTHTTDFDNPPYKDTLGIFGTQNAIVPLYPSTTDHLPTLQSGIYSDYFANRTNNSLVRAITIKMYFDRIHSSIEEVKTYNSGNTSAAGVDGRAYRHTAVKTTTQRESALLNSIVNATSVGESSATQIGGALHRVLKYAPDKILSDIATEGVSTYVNNIINFRLTVDTDIANHHIIIQNGLNTLGSLTYDNLNNTIDRTDTNYAGYGFTIYEAMQRWDYDAYNALRYGDPTLYPANSDEIRSQDPVPGTPSEAQKKVQIYIERYENAIVQLKNKLFGVNGAFYSHNKLAIENANKFELTADVQGDEWGWDSDAWDAHEYNTATETNEVKRSWDDGGNLNNLYSEFKNFSSEKDINGDRVGWHAYDFERDLGVSVEQVKYGTNFIYVYASGRPDHEHGPFPNANNPNVILNQNALWKIPLTVNIPIVKESTPLGPIGIARNGVVIYNPKDATSFLSENIWHQNAVTQEVGIDAANGHTNEKGQYHYHQNPKAMYDDNAYEHSPLLGYAWDGVPIYGPRAYPNVNGTGEIRRIRSSYRLKTGTRTAIGTETVPTGAYDGTYVEDFEYIVGLGELDQYNGRSAITPEYPNGVYAYYVTVDDLDQSVYPYIIGPEYYGIPNKENYTNTPGPVITEEISVKTRYLPNVTVDRNNRDSKGFIRPQHEQYPEEYVPVYSKEGLTVTTETHAVRVKIVDDNLLETTDGYRFASAYATVSNGAVTGLTLNHGGTGYIGPATVDIIGTVGTGATATATVDGININLLILGSGYTSAPTITFSGGSGINATAIATISNGKVVTIFVTNHGTGYTSSPTVNITGGGGSSATATAVVDAIGTLTLTAGGTGYLDLQTSMRSYYNEHGNKKVYALSDALGTTLASNIAQGDTEIQVTDVLKLPKPVAASYNRGNPVPGVIYIGSERVQYFHINEANNKLLECRRGTGTTTDQAHTSGEKIFSITDFVTLTDNIEETWSPHATYGLINSTSANARFFKENKGKAIT